MRLLLLICLSGLISYTSSAQIGFNGSYLSPRASTWEGDIHELAGNNSLDFYRTGYKVGLDYWFRLKPVRIEFLPELSWANTQTVLNNSQSSLPATFNTDYLGFQFNISVYPFDFFSDCDCPTWSKQNDFLKRGFYVQLAPGIHQLRHSYEEGKLRRDARDESFSLALGLGLDIGATDLFTFTPFAKFHYFFDPQWAGWETLPYFTDFPPAASDGVVLQWIELGLRLGLRWQE